MARRMFWNALVLLTAVAEILVSIIIVYCSSRPIIVFRGSVEGWVSLTSYKLLVLGEPLDSHIYDYLSFMSILMFLAAGLALTFSLASILSLLRPRLRRVAIPGLFASSLVLLVALSIMQALLRLASVEASHIEVRSLRTSAGLITFPREEIIHTHAYSLATSKWLLIAVLVSIIASSYILYTLPEETAKNKINMRQTHRE